MDIHFVPPPQRRSLLGALSQYAANGPEYGTEEWQQAREAAWAAAWQEKERARSEDPER